MTARQFHRAIELRRQIDKHKLFWDDLTLHMPLAQQLRRERLIRKWNDLPEDARRAALATFRLLR